MKLRPGTALHVSLAFAPQHVLDVGRLAMDRGTAVLEYSAQFLASGLEINPRLGRPGRELVRAREPRIFQGLHGVFADSLPDAWGELLMRRRAEQLEVAYSSLTALDKLAWVGERGMGALTYRPVITPGTSDERVDLDELARASAEILGGRASDIVPKLERLGGSAGGARPKVLVGIGADESLIAGTESLPPGFEAWLVKFRGPSDYEDVGPLETAYAEMARAAGLAVPPVKLIGSGKRAYFATKRFDRGPGGARHHMLSVAGLLDIDWRTPNLDYTALLNAVRLVTRREADVEEMFRRMIFNVVAHNRDDHTKQHAFLMDEAGRWRLAPAYDLTFAHGPGGEHYLTVAGEAADVSAKAIASVARSQGIAEKRTREITAQVSTAVAEFPRFARDYGVSRRTAAEIGPALRGGLARFSVR